MEYDLSEMIYAIDQEWLATLYPPDAGCVYIMSRDGVFCASCEIGSLRGRNEFVMSCSRRAARTANEIL